MLFQPSHIAFPQAQPGSPPAASPRCLSPAEAMAEIIRLMSISPHHKYMFLSELEWAVLPPLRLGQFRLFHDKGRVVGYVSWAMVSEAVEARMKSGGRRLRPEEWKSGGKRVVVDVVAPFGGGEKIVRGVCSDV